MHRFSKRGAFLTPYKTLILSFYPLCQIKSPNSEGDCGANVDYGSPSDIYCTGKKYRVVGEAEDNAYEIIQRMGGDHR